MKTHSLYTLYRQLRGHVLASVLAFTAFFLGSFLPQRALALSASAPQVKPSVAAEFKALQARAEDARQDMSRWLTNTAPRDERFADKPHNVLSFCMEHRFQKVCADYADFLSRHPGHLEAKVMVDSFRSDFAEDLEAIRHWEEAREEDPDSPAPWNELAHYFCHSGNVTVAFACFEKSLELAPREAVYFSDFATTLILYRSDAARHYRLTEQDVFEKALKFYRRGLKLEPTNYALAAHYAENFYLITPLRREEGLAAWQHAYSLASTASEGDEARVHLARYAITSNHLNLARCYLDQVNDPRFERVKEVLLRRINESHKSTQDVVIPEIVPAAKL